MGKHAKNRRQYIAGMKESEYISKKSDNRVVCPKNGRKKFLYPTLKKARLACSYSERPQRPYYCKSCCGFHTTSETKEEYYDNIEDRIGVEVQRTEREYKFVEQDHRAVRRGRSEEEIKAEVEEIWRRAYEDPAPF